jgi:hypothetical protein
MEGRHQLLHCKSMSGELPDVLKPAQGGRLACPAVPAGPAGVVGTGPGSAPARRPDAGRGSLRGMYGSMRFRGSG